MCDLCVLVETILKSLPFQKSIFAEGECYSIKTISISKEIFQI